MRRQALLIGVSSLLATACGTRAAPAVGDPPAADRTSCGGADRAVLFGAPVEFNELSASWDNRWSEEIEVRFSNLLGPPVGRSPSSSWSGLILDFVPPTPATLQAGPPLWLALADMPAGWEFQASRYGGGCDENGLCKSAATSVLAEEAPLLTGTLQVTGDRPPTLSLCLGLRTEPRGEVELFVYVKAVTVEYIRQ